MAKKVQKPFLQNVMQNWDILLNGQGKKQEEFYKAFEKELHNRVKVKTDRYSHDGIAGIQVAFRSIYCNVFAIPFGADLFVSWDMQSKKISPSKSPSSLGGMIDSLSKTFSYVDVKVGAAFGSVVLDCIRAAIFELMGDKADKAKMSRQSSGMLGSF